MEICDTIQTYLKSILRDGNPFKKCVNLYMVENPMWNFFFLLCIFFVVPLPTGGLSLWSGVTAVASELKALLRALGLATCGTDRTFEEKSNLCFRVGGVG